MVEAILIQIIPFLTNKEPEFLPLLVRGLSDLSALRLSEANIESQTNVDLEISQWYELIKNPEIKFEQINNLEELWLCGELSFENGIFTVILALFNPEKQQIVYRDLFEVPERQILSEWENHFLILIQRISGSFDNFQMNRPLYTRSLEAFLEFRRGLETLSLAKNQSQRESGLENLLNAVAYDPDFTEAADILLLFLFQNGVSKNLDESLKILERLRKIAENHPRIPLVMAELYYQWGNPEKAEHLFIELTKSFPDFIEGWLRVALFYHSLGQYSKALSALETILSIDSENATALDLMGAVYTAVHEHAKAEEAWLKTLKIDPNRVNVLNNLGLLSEEKGNIIKAEGFYQRAINLNGNWWGSFYNYGSFCARQGRLEEAAVFLEKSGKLNPAHIQTFMFLSKVYIKLGRYSEAQEQAIHLLEIAPDNVIRRQGLQLLSQLNHPEIQIELKLRKLEKIWESGKRWLVFLKLSSLLYRSKNMWYYWYLWGRIFEDINLDFLANLTWRLGLRQRPGFVLLKKLGLYYWGKKNYRKALPLLRKSFKIHKSDGEILNAYLQTLISLGETEEYHSNLRKLSMTGHTLTE